MANVHPTAIVEPGAEVRMSSPFGALLLGWAEGPEAGVDTAAVGSARAQRSSLFGF